MTSLEFLGALIGASRVVFRYDGSPKATSRWSMVLETPSGARQVACAGRLDLPSDADPEALARAELLERARLLRLGASHRREEQGGARARSEQYALSARVAASEASDLEAEADALEAGTEQALLALILGVSEVEFAYQQETDLGGRSFGPPIWHVRKSGDLGFSPMIACRKMPPTATPEELAKMALLYLHGQIHDALRTETERVEELRAELLRAEDRVSSLTKNAQRISAFPGMRSVLK